MRGASSKLPAWLRRFACVTLRRKDGSKAEYVVPPLKGFWWQDNVDGMDYGNKNFLQIARWEENNR